MKNTDNIEQNYKDIVSSVANDYFDSLKNEPKLLKMSFEQASEYCRKLAQEDVDELLQEQQKALIDRIEKEVIGKNNPEYDEIATGMSNIEVRAWNGLRTEQRTKLNQIKDKLS